ncbi:hypothetical protein LTR70_001395 [Exophiala xenobiotica]|uniref:Aminotransferase class I/classII large domain-containing protein n=1 Tax=Lithohypha guttulata TaxID=1690604 RepID=A0ABR0KMG8_9EURO|nr:hypothetical protein LTR24_000850 [Lithohypha guttulata]KAK5328074.1 hypothetical protein LTR70_001395 [Exophiala xenobiotica]
MTTKGDTGRGSPTSLEQALATALRRRESQSKLRTLKSSSPGSVDFSSNDFLSLATTKEFREEYLGELQQQILPVGSTGSRLLDGNSQYAEQLEQQIAAFHGAESGLLIGSGFDANVSIFTCLPQPGDTVLYDELIHASVHDGLHDFQAKLKLCTSSSQNVFVAVESVYSMDGDLAPLSEMVSIMKEVYPGNNCHLIVDEAHATGIYGPRGRGRVSELGLEQDVLVRLHTFGKALGSNGAVILCSPTIRSYLINYARPIIFTTFLSYPNLAAVKVAYEWLAAGKTETLSSQLTHLIEYMYARLRSLGPLARRLEAGSFTLPDACPQSAIFALMMQQPRELAAYCQAAGFVVRAVMHPTVPLGTERVRICLHAGNTEQEIDALVDRVRQWLEQKAACLPTSSSDDRGVQIEGASAPAPQAVQTPSAAVLAKL